MLLTLTLKWLTFSEVAGKALAIGGDDSAFTVGNAAEEFALIASPIGIGASAFTEEVIIIKFAFAADAIGAGKLPSAPNFSE